MKENFMIPGIIACHVQYTHPGILLPPPPFLTQGDNSVASKGQKVDILTYETESKNEATSKKYSC